MARKPLSQRIPEIESIVDDLLKKSQTLEDVEVLGQELARRKKDQLDQQKKQIDIIKAGADAVTLDAPSFKDALEIGAVKLIDTPESIDGRRESFDDTGLTGQFLRGLSLNRFNQEAEPETTGEAISNIGGQIFTGVGIALGAGRFGRFARGAVPRLGAVGEFGVRVGAEAGTVAAISPEDDIKQELALTGTAEFFLNTGVGRRTLGQLGRIARITKAKQVDEAAKPTSEVAAEIDTITSPRKLEDQFKDTPEFQQKIINFSESVNDLVQVRRGLKDQATKLTESFRTNSKGQTSVGLRREARDMVSTEIEKLADEFKTILDFGNRTFAKKQLDTILRTIDNDSGVLSGQDVQDIFKTKLGRLPDDLEQVQFTAPTPLIKSLQGEVDFVLDKIKQIDENVRVGLKPSASIDDYIKRVDEIDTKLKQFEDDVLVSNPKYIELKDNLNKQVSELLEDPDKRFLTEFPNSSAFAGFMQNLKRVVPEEVGIDQLSRLEKVAIRAARDSQEVPIDIANSVRKAFSNLPHAEEVSLEKISNFLRGGLPDITNTTKQGRELLRQSKKASTSLILKYLDSHSEELIKDIPGVGNFRSEMDSLLDQLTQTKHAEDFTQADAIEKQIKSIKSQFSQIVLSDPIQGSQLFAQNGDGLLEKLHLTFRAVHGDKQAQRILIFQDKAADSIMSRGLAEAQAGSNLIEGAEEARKAQLVDYTDLTGWQRWTNPWLTPERVLRPLTKSVPEASRALDWLQEAQVASNKYLLDTKPKIVKELEGKFNSAGKNVRQAGADLIRRVDEVATNFRDLGESDEFIEEQITKMVDAASPEVRELYTSYRDVMDDALDLWNSHIKQFNKDIDNKLLDGDKIPEITKRPGFFPHIWEGSYKIKFKDSDGLLRIIGDAESNGEAVAKIRELLRLNPEMNGSVILEPRIMSSLGDDLDSIGSFAEDLDRLTGVDSKVLRDLMGNKKYDPKELQNLFFGNRLKRTANAEDFIQDPIKALDLYLHGGGKFSFFLRALRQSENAAKILENTVDKNFRPMRETADYLRTLSNDIVGRPGKWQRRIDEVVESVVRDIDSHPVAGAIFRASGFKPNGKMTSALVSSLLTFGRLATIGFNPSTALINMGILATNVAPTIGSKRLTSAIFKARNPKSRKAYQHLIERAGIDIFQGGATLREITTSPSLLKSRNRQFLDWLDSTSLWMFNKTENAARVTTLIAGRDEAELLSKRVAKKLASGKELKSSTERLYKEVADRLGTSLDAIETKDQFAIDYMFRTNFDFDKTGLAEIFRRPTLKPFLQFKTFMMKQLDFMFGGDLSRAEQFKVMSAFTALGGLFAIPGMNMLDAAYTAGFGESPKLTAQRHVPDWIVAGLPRLAGVDISQRLAVDDLQFALDVRNIFGIAPATLFEAGSQVVQGRPERALTMMTPPAFRAAQDAYELYTTGEMRSRFDGRVVVTEEDLDNPKLAAFFEGLAFESSVAKDTRSVRSLMRIKSIKAKRRKKNVKNRIFNLIREGNKDKANKLMKENGITLREVNELIKEKNMKEHQRLSRRLPRDLKESPELELIK